MWAPGSPVLALGRGAVSRAGVGAAEAAGADEAGVITRADADRSPEGSAGAFIAKGSDGSRLHQNLLFRYSFNADGEMNFVVRFRECAF